MINQETFKNLFKKWKTQSPKTFDKLVNTDFESIRQANKAIKKGKTIQLNKPQSQRYNGMTMGQYQKQPAPGDREKVETHTTDSSAVQSIEYDPKKGNLDVTFVGGDKEYRYPEVPKEVAESFMRAPSKGQFVDEVLSRYSDIGHPEVQKKIREGN